MFHNTHLTRERHRAIMSTHSPPTSPYYDPISSTSISTFTSNSSANSTMTTPSSSSTTSPTSPSFKKLQPQASLQQPIRPSTSPPKKGFLSDLKAGKTPGVRNIEKAYSRAGASDNSTPGSASRLGSQSQESSEGYTGQGVGSRKFGERIGGQRGESNKVGKLWNNMINGTDSTK